MKTKPILLFAALLALTAPAAAQNVHHGESFELNAPLSSGQNHEYTASSHINLKNGFHSEPGPRKSTILQLDPYGVFPPETGLTGGPNTSDTGVVGAIGGMVDVGLMGAAIYSIPLELPAGINGMQPSLSVTYNSQAGNGLLGWGWDLSGLSAIERTGQTRYHDGACGAVALEDETDRLTLDGKRLIVMADYIDSIEYKTEQDEMAKITAYFRQVSMGGFFGYGSVRFLDHFVVRKADGITMEYGTTEDSKIEPQSESYSTLCWLLSRIYDRNGNAVVYHYVKYPSTGEYYISAIDYTQHSENGNVTVRPEFTVSFHYRSKRRKDYDFRYMAGNLLMSRKLLNHISVSSNCKNAELERYSFDYRGSGPGRPYDSVYMHERLVKIRLEKGGETLNATKIIWSRYKEPDAMNRIYMQESDTAIYKNFPFVGDFNGDGYSDLAVVPIPDSVYTHPVDIRFFLNNHDNPGHFLSAPSLTLQGVDKHLDWLYPMDLNDDGLDDLVACFYDSIAGKQRDTMCVKILENVSGTHFVCRDSLPFGGCRLLIRAGDFLGTGKTQLLLMPVTSNPILPLLAFSILVYYDGSNIVKSISTSMLFDVRDIATGDFNGDGRSEVLVVKDSASTVYSLSLSNGFPSYAELFSTSDINHANGQWNHVFTGDFNGDGMTDVLYSHKENNTKWRIFYATGPSFTSSGYIGSLALFDLPTYNLFSHSLRKIYDAFNHNNKDGYWNHSVCVADFDGDGVDDIAISTMTPTYSSINIYFHYNPFEGDFQSIFQGASYNGHHPSPYINCRSQYFHTGYFTSGENISFLGLEYRNIPNANTHNKPGVFSLKPSSALNSVVRITDGLGNKTEFSYNYVRQSYQELGYGVRRISVPIRVLKSITGFNASDNPSTVHLGYSDPCYHRDGHGWIGFRKLVRKSFENGVEKGRTVSVRSLETMGRHAMLLPESDTSYVFPSGTAVLSSATSYQFDKVCSSFGSLNTNRLVTCPALTGKTTVKYDPDHPNTILSKTFTENHYNYTDGVYYRVYRCDSVLTGVGDLTATCLANCEFKTTASTIYYWNDYATWTINRPHDINHIQSRRGKPDVERCQRYEYKASDSYLPSRVYDIPNRVPNQDPLMLQTNYEYFSDGNLKKKTVKAPHGQLGEQQKTFEYEYGPDGQLRLVTSETVSSGDLSYTTSYSYDDYDRIDTLTFPNGLATAYTSDAFGITSWTHNADNTRSCTALRWTQEHPLAPEGAAYYSWERSSNGFQSLIFYHKTGTELRSVTYGLRGEPIITDRKYDDRGRLRAVSEPYKEGETVRWTVYGYDNLDRLTSVTTPDSTSTTTVYNGFQTETVVLTPQGVMQESAVRVNVMGWTVRSNDASGSYVIYDHYADGLMATATVNGNAATAVTASYDNARRRTTLADPDYGTLTTAFDAYGRLKRSVSPREMAAQTETVNFYDGLDRLAKTTDGLENTRTDYIYNETGVKKGTLDEVAYYHQDGPGIQHFTYSYDKLARPVSVTEQRATGTYTTAVTYDSQSRVSRIVHPSGVAVRYGYHHGYLREVTDDVGYPLWKTNAMDARGQILEAQLGNGVITQHAYDTVTHRLTGIVTTNNLQNLSYDYDKFGNLASRKDNNKNLREVFTYDNMNRLTGITLERSSGQDLHCDVTYDALGRMTSKQAVTAANGTPQVSTVFSQPAFDAAKVHALTMAQTSENVFPATAQSVTYTGFDKANKIKQGNDSICYTYGYDHQRIRMEEYIGSTVRTKDYLGMCEYVTETDAGSGGENWLTYLSGPTGVFAVVLTKNGTSQTFYILKDNLGSWTTITDGDGVVEQRLSYDAWGNLRNPNTWANYTAGDSFDKPMFDRGYTGHEHLTSFGLINMNGRMYDPVMSSFLSADRYVQDPTSSQGFNRYAYCMYNPLKFVDPSGWLAGHGGPRYVSGLIQDYLSDPCYVTREQLREAGIYNIEGGYGYAGGGGTMGAHWMDGFGTCHYSSWYIQTEGGGFEAGAWAIPSSFNPMWANDCQGYCDFGNMNCVKGESNQNSNSNSATSQGSRGGGGNWGGGRDRVKNPVSNNINTILGYVVTTESTLFGTRSYSLKQLKNQKVLDELGKSLRTTYETRGIVQKGLSGMEVGKVAVGRMTTASNVLGGVGIALVGVDVILNDNIIYPSHVLDVGIGAASIFAGPPGWIIGGSYLLIDLGSYAFSGKPFGQHLNTWCGGVGYDIKTNSFVYKKW